MKRKNALFGALVFAAACGAVGTAWAQDAYPNKPITMIVPFPPGGAADIAARPIAEAMGRFLKQPIVIENRAGAGGGIGMAQVARAKPDGYTILMALSSIVVLPEADGVLKRSPMYKLAQLKPIARFTADPVVLVVQASSPWKDFAQFAAAVKASPGRYTFGSSGNYGTMHVPVEQFKAATQSSMLHIPYTGAGPAVVALLSGQVDAVATGPSTVATNIQAGKLRALAQWGEARIPTMPNVPTMKELGIPVSYSQWTGVFTPAGTPDAVVARLREASKFAAADAHAVAALQAAGTYIQFLDTPEFEKFVDKEATAMAKVVQRIGRVE
jgi:tripartite-type tricarboxylate transporter receptor subunit TctC